MRSLFRVIIASLMLVSIISCDREVGVGGSGSDGGSALSIRPESFVLAPGAIAPFQVLDRDSQDITNDVAIEIESGSGFVIDGNTIRALSDEATGIIKVTHNNDYLTTTVDVVQISIEKLLQPSLPRMYLGGESASLVLLGVNSDDKVVEVENNVEWISSNESIALVEQQEDGSPMLRPIATGSILLKAIYTTPNEETLSVEQDVAIHDLQAETITISPSDLALTVGEARNIVAYADYDSAERQNITGQVRWVVESEEHDIEAVTLNEFGNLNVSEVGNYSIYAELNGGERRSEELELTVTPTEVRSLKMSPQTLNLTLWQTGLFNVVAQYSDDSEVDVTDQVTFAYNGAGDELDFAQPNTRGGLVKALKPSSQLLVTATLPNSDLFAQAVVEVTEDKLLNISTNKTEVYSFVGNNFTLITEAHSELNQILEVTNESVYSIQDTAILKSLGEGRFSPVAPGNTTIDVSYTDLEGNDFTTSVSVTVDPRQVATLSLSPEELSITQGSQQTFSVMAALNDGSTQDVTELVDWTLSGDTVVGSIDPDGTFSAEQVGSAQLIATSVNGLHASNPATITVTPKIPVSLVLSHNKSSLIVGDNARFNVRAFYADGSSEVVTHQATLRVIGDATESVIELSKTLVGDFYVRGSGNVVVQADYKGQTTTLDLAISNQAILGINVSPPVTVMYPETQFTLVTEALLSDGSAVSLSDNVYYSSSDETILEVNNGTVKALKAGVASVTSVYINAQNQLLTSTRFITIENKRIVSVDFEDSATPRLARSASKNSEASDLIIGQLTKLTVLGTLDTGETVDVSYLMQYQFNDNNIGEFNHAAELLPNYPGSATIKAAVYLGDDQISADRSVNVATRHVERLQLDNNDTFEMKLGDIRNINVRAYYSDGTYDNVTAEALYVPEQADIVAFSSVAKGWFSAIGEGEVTVKILAAGLEKTIAVEVTVDRVESVHLLPSTPQTLFIGGSLELRLNGTSSSGNVVDLTEQTQFTAVDSSIAVFDGNQLRAISSGTTEVVASVTTGGTLFTKSLQVTVQPEVFTGLSLEPNGIIDRIGGTTQLQVIGRIANGTPFDVTESVYWQFSGDYVGHVSEDGVFHATDGGTSTLQAIWADGSIRSNAIAVEVNDSIAKVTLLPAQSALFVGDKLEMTLLAKLGNGFVVDATEEAVFSSSNPSAATIDSDGIVDAVAVGDTQITATYDDGSLLHTSTAILNISSRHMSAIDARVLPDNVKNITLSLGETAQLQAIASYEVGAPTRDVTSEVNWRFDGETLGSVNNIGLFTATKMGTSDLSASDFDGDVHSGPISITVEEAKITSIEFSDDDVVLNKGTETQLRLFATYSDDSRREITSDSGTLFSHNAGSGLTLSTTTAGRLIGNEVGEYVVSASNGSLSVDAKVSVVDSRVTAITVNPRQATLDITEELPLQVLATLANGMVSDVSVDADTSYTSSDSSVLIIKDTNVVDPKSVGTASVTVNYNNGGDVLVATAQFVIENHSVTGLQIIPSRAAISVDEKVALKAFATLKSGEVLDVTSNTTFNSSDLTVVTISSSNDAVAVNVGQASIHASYTQSNISVNATSAITVTSDRIESLSVSPSNIDLKQGQTTQLTATANYGGGVTKDVTTLVAWQLDSALGTIDSNGLFTANNTGTSSLRAVSYGGDVTSSDVPVSVSAKGRTGIRFSVSDLTAREGGSVQLQVLASYTDGSEGDITNATELSFTDNGPNPNDVVINGTGLLNANVEGDYVVTATIGTGLELHTAQVNLNVVDESVESINITPVRTIIGQDENIALRTFATLATGEIIDVTSDVQFSSSDISIAVVNGTQANLIEGRSQGQVEITGTYTQAGTPTLTDTSVITVTSERIRSLSVTPNTVTANVGEATSLTATAFYGDDSSGNPISENVTRLVDWTFDGNVLGDIDSDGIFVARSVGTSGIRAVAHNSGIESPSISVIVNSKVRTGLSFELDEVAIALSGSLQLEPIAIYSDGSTEVLTSGVSFTHIGGTPTDLSFTAGGLMTGNEEGNYTVTASIGSGSTQHTASMDVEVINGKSVSITVTPSVATLHSDERLSLRAYSTLALGQVVDVTSSTDFVSSDTSVVTASSNTIEAQAVGQANITATYTPTGSASQTATAAITVTGDRIETLTVTPANANLNLGESQQLTVMAGYGTDSGGLPITKDVTTDVRWQVIGNTRGSINNSGLFTSTSEGSTTLRAIAYNGVESADVDIVVAPKAITSIDFTPGEITLDRSTSVQLHAFANYTDGSRGEITTDATTTFTHNGGGALTLSTTTPGLLSAHSVGDYVATVSSGSFTANADVTVVDSSITAITVNPRQATMDLTEELPLQVLATLANGMLMDVTSDASTSYTSSDSSVLLMKNTNVVDPQSVGIATITVNHTSGSNTFASSVRVNVKDNVVEGLEIVPNRAAISVDESVALKALATLQSGEVIDVTSDTTFNSSDLTIVKISSLKEAEAVDEGHATISASYTKAGVTVNATSSITVTSDRIESLSVSPSSINLKQGETTQLTATANYGGSTTKDVTALVAWQLDSALGTIDSNGLFTANNTGTSSLRAVSYGGDVTSSDVPVSVSAKGRTGIRFSVSDLTAREGGSVQLQVLASYSDGSEGDITSATGLSFTDNGPNPNNVVIDSTGLLIANDEGDYVVTATIGMGLELHIAQLNLNVVDESVESINITPARTIIGQDENIALRTFATLATGEIIDVTSDVLFSSSDTSTAVVNGTQANLIEGRSQGQVEITGTYAQAGSPTFTDTSVITVTNERIRSLSVTPNTVTTNVGQATSLTAIAFYGLDSGGNPISENVTRLVDWTFDGNVLGDIDSDGIFVARSVGTSGIRAVAHNSGIESPATTVTVNSKVRTGLSFELDEVAIALGGSLQLEPIATYSDGSTEVLTSGVSFTHIGGTPTGLSFTAGGLMTGDEEGNYTVTASIGSGATQHTVTMDVEVINGNSVSITVTPSVATLHSDERISLRAYSTMASGQVVDVTSNTDFVSSDTSVVTASSNTIEAQAVGQANITATYTPTGSASQTATAAITVTGDRIETLTVTPASTNLNLGESQQLTVMAGYGTDSGGLPITKDVTTDVRWQVIGNTRGSINNSGLFTSTSEGSTTLRAIAYNGVESADIAIVVAPKAITSIDFTPDEITLDRSTTVQLHAFANYTDGSRGEITSDATTTFTHNGGGALTLSTTTPGLLSAHTVGDYVATVSSGSFTANADVTVVDSSITAITVNPRQATMDLTEELPLQVLATLANGMLMDVTSDANTSYTSSDSSVLVMKNTNVVDPQSVGIATITVNHTSGSNTFASSVRVSVKDNVVEGLQIVPNRAAISVDESVALKALATLKSGEVIDVTSDTTFNSSDLTIVKISSLKEAEAVDEGYATISASYTKAGVTVNATSSITVISDRIESLSVSPSSINLKQGETTQLTATANYGGSTTKDVTALVAWQLDSALGTIDSNGLFTANNTGTSSLRAVAYAGDVISSDVPVSVSAKGRTGIRFSVSDLTAREGGSVQLQVLASYTDGSEGDITSATGLSFTDNGPNPSNVVIDATGLLTANDEGDYVVTATIGTGLDLHTAQLNLNVVDMSVQSINITPARTIIGKDENIALQVIATLATGEMIDVTSDAQFLSVNDSIATMSSTQANLVEGRSQGQVEIIGTYTPVGAANLTDTSVITVTNERIRSLSVTPSSVNINLGETAQLTATAEIGTDSGGNPITQNVTQLVDWAFNVNVLGDISADGTFVARSTGTSTLQAVAHNSGVESAAITVTVNPKVRTGLSFELNEVSVALGGTLQLEPIATYSDGTTEVLTSGVTFSDNGGTATDLTFTAGGLMTANEEGDYIVTASIGTGADQHTATLDVEVLNGSSVSVAVTPSIATLHEDETLRLRVYSTLATGHIVDVTGDATFLSSDSTVVSVSAGTNLVEAQKPGQVTITATYTPTGGTPQNATAVLTVIGDRIETLVVTPSSSTLSLGETQQLTVMAGYGNDSGGTPITKDVTTDIQWQVIGTERGTVSNSGLFTSTSQGSTALRAIAYNGIESADVNIVVGAKAVTSIEFAQTTVTLDRDTSVQLHIFANYTDGSIEEITNNTSLTLTDNGSSPTDIEFDSVTKGLMTANEAGDYVVTATLNTFTATLPVTVVYDPVVSISVNPNDLDFYIGQEIHLITFAHYQSGKVMDISGSVTLTSSNPGIVTIDQAAASITAAALGETVLTSAYAGDGSCCDTTVNVTVEPRPLNVVRVSASSTTLKVGESVQLTATAETSASSSSTDVTADVRWVSSDTSKVWIEGNGLLHAVGQGTADVSAVLYNGQVESADTTFTITAKTMDRLEVRPDSLTLVDGETKTVQIFGIYSDGTEADVTTSATLSSLNGLVTVTNGSGDVVGIGSGSDTINIGITTPSTLNTTLPVEVTNGEFVSIDIACPTQVNAGLTDQCTATGTLTNATTYDLTNQVTWSSATPANVSVDHEGQVTANAVGTSVISARYHTSLGELTDNATVSTIAANVVSLAATVQKSKVPTDTRVDFHVDAIYSNGTVLDVTTNASLTANYSGSATITYTGNQLEGDSASTGNLSYQFGSVTSNALPFELVSVDVVDLRITPDMDQLATSVSQTFTATAIFSDGSQLDVSDQATWNVVAIGGSGSFTGAVFTPSTAGEVLVTATFDSYTSDPDRFNIISAAPTAVIIGGGTVNLAAGLQEQQQLRVTLSTTPVSWVEVTEGVIWEIADTSIATVDDDGMISAVGAGTTTLRAYYQGFESSESVVVTSATISRIEVTPGVTTTIAGYDVQFSATAILSNGAEQDITADAGSTWTVVQETPSGPTADIIAASSTKGLFTTEGEGHATIRVTNNSVSSENILINILEAEITELQLASPTIDVVNAGFTNFTLAAKYSTQAAGDPAIALTSAAPVHFTYTNPKIGVIEGGFRYKGRFSAGKNVITATIDGVTSNELTIWTRLMNVVSIAYQPGLGTNLHGRNRQEVIVEATLENGSTVQVDSSLLTHSITSPPISGSIIIFDGGRIANTRQTYEGAAASEAFTLESTYPGSPPFTITRNYSSLAGPLFFDDQLLEYRYAMGDGGATYQASCQSYTNGILTDWEPIEAASTFTGFNSVNGGTAIASFSLWSVAPQKFWIFDPADPTGTTQTYFDNNLTPPTTGTDPISSSYMYFCVHRGAWQDVN